MTGIRAAANDKCFALMSRVFMIRIQKSGNFRGLGINVEGHVVCKYPVGAPICFAEIFHRRGDGFIGCRGGIARVDGLDKAAIFGTDGSGYAGQRSEFIV